MSQRARANLLGPTIPSPIAGEGLSELTRLSQTSLATEPASPLQAQVDGMVSHFAEEAGDWQALAAMTTGGIAFRGTRIGTLALGEGRLAAVPLRFFSYGIGLGTEVAAFEGTGRFLGSLRGDANPNRWKWDGVGGWRQGLASSFITFGLLKGAGGFSQGQNILFQHLFSDLAMVGGHQLASTLHFLPRPEGSLAEQLLHAEATNLQLGVGMSLVHSFSPGLATLERSLDLSLRADSLRAGVAPTLVTGAAQDLNGPLLAQGSLGPEALSRGLPRPSSSERKFSVSLSFREGESREGEGEGTQDSLYQSRVSPSGLILQPREQSDLFAVAYQALENEALLPNRRIVLDLRHWASPPRLESEIRAQLQRLSDQYATSICLKTAAEPFAEEIEPALVRADPSKQVPLLAMREDFDWARLKDAIIRIKGSPAGHAPEDREPLLKLARQVDRERNGRAAQWHTLFAMRDFPKLRELADELMRLARQGDWYLHDWENAVVSSLLTESHEAVFKKLEGAPFQSFEVNSDVVENPFERLVTTSVPISQTHAISYAAQRGFTKTYYFGFLETFRNLLALSKDYDVFVGIARGGLFSASVADLLGFPNFVMEVHAHNRKRPTSRWVDAVGEGQISGKRVLLFDKDAVTGATIKEAVRLLNPLRPSEIGVYFNHRPSNGNSSSFPPPPSGGGEGPRLRMELAFPNAPRVLPDKAARRIEALGVRIHHPENITPAPLHPAYHAAHERLNTQSGRLDRIERRFREEILPRAMELSPSVGAGLAAKWSDAVQDYRHLNPLVPGVKAVREILLRSWEASLAQFHEAIRTGFRSLQAEETYVFLSHLLGRNSPDLLAEELAKARYGAWGIQLAKERGIRLLHMPHQYMSAFRTAREAVEKGRYEAAVIVGPEAFAYEPIFRDLGLPTFAVNIPETEFGGKRTLKRLEDLTPLKGRRVLVVEDDVRSGATLKRLLKTLRFSGPFAELGLYLGLPTVRQLPENIPSSFQQVFIADPRSDDASSFLRHLSARVPLFKTEADGP